MEDTKTVTPQPISQERITWHCQDGYQWLDEFERSFNLAFRHNPLLDKACAGLMRELAEARRRLSDRCPVLIGFDMGYVECCQCSYCTDRDHPNPWDCDYDCTHDDRECTDPFQDV